MEKNLVPGNRYFLYVVQPTYRPLANPFCYPMRADFVKLETVGGEYRYLLKNFYGDTNCISLPKSWITDLLLLENIPQLNRLPIDVLRIIDSYY